MELFIIIFCLEDMVNGKWYMVKMKKKKKKTGGDQ